jgi:cytochrome c oxidase subunit 2
MRKRKLPYFVVFMLLVGAAIVGTRYYEVDVPLWRLLGDPNHVDPATLHLSGEFVESNLGTAQEPDGSVTVRMIALQYLFVPHCIVVPAGTPVRVRITSADAVHKLTFDGTDYSVKVVPGAVSEGRIEFSRPGEYKMPCREFCGAGHFTMRSRLVAVPREQFPDLQPGERRDCDER